MIALIVAHDANGLIGKDGTLPWHYKEDLRYFKDVTSAHKVIMGRVTYDSILASLKKPLPNRENIVVSRQNLKDARITLVHDLDAYLQNVSDDETVFVIGGKKIYTIALPYADRLYITHIDGVYEGDTYFPDYDKTQFKKISEKKTQNLTFAVYERI